MSVIAKIRAEIEQHMAEIEKLQSALEIVEKFENAPTPKASPMFTVQKIGGVKAETAGEELPLAEQILKLLANGKALKVHDISKRLDYGDRTKTSASNPINSLKKRGLIVAVGNGKYALKGYTGKVKETSKTGVSIRAQVMAAFEAFHHPLSRDDLLNLIDLQGRSLHTFDSCLSKLKLESVIHQDESAKFTLASRALPVSEDESVEPTNVQLEGQEASDASRAA
jgi:hypothetical protein